MPDCFAVTDTGLLLVANGIDPVARWNGRGPATAAGIVRPVYGTLGGGNGDGTIGGDKPIAGTVADPSTGMDASPGRPGTFVTYVAYIRYVDADGNVSDFSPPITMQVQAARIIAYHDIPLSPDPRVVAVQVFRNTAGQLTTFYLDAEGLPAPYPVIDGFGHTVMVVGLSSDLTDALLQTQPAVPLFDDSGQPFAMSHAPPPDYYSVIVPHISRMFMCGVEEYAEGSVAVTLNSAAVVGTGTAWPATFTGRFLHVPGNRPVEIQACNQATQTITLAAPWTGPTDRYSSYAVRPAPALGNGIVYSNANEPEGWPAYQQLAVTEDGDQVRGLMPYGSFVFVLKERHLYRLTAQADPGRDGFLFLAARRGALSQRCWVVADEIAFVMDRQGIYQFTNGQPQDVSGQIQNLFRDTDGPQINFACARWFHAAYSPGEQAVKFFVTIYGDKYPTRALVYYYRINKWTVERLPFPVTAACVARTGRPGGWSRADDRLMLGHGAGQIVAFDAGVDDGTPATTLRVAAATSAAVVVRSIRSGPTNGLSNMPMAVSKGRGVGQHRVIVGNLGTHLFVDRPWAVKPDETSELILGGIACEANLSAMRMAPSENQEGCSIEMRHRPSRDSKARLEIAYDYGQRADRALPARVGSEIALDLPSGVTIKRLDQHKERQTSGRRFVRFSVKAVSGRETFGMDEILLNGVI